MSSNTSTHKNENKKADANAGVNANAKPQLPNERDTAPETDAQRPREKIKQAARDLQQGQVDTDQHGERGIDQAVNPGNVIETPKSPHDAAKKTT